MNFVPPMTRTRTAIRSCRADAVLLCDVHDRLDRVVEMLPLVCRADLTAQPRLPLRHHRKSEAGEIHAVVEQLRRHRDRLRGIADDDRNDRMNAFAYGDSV